MLFGACVRSCRSLAKTHCDLRKCIFLVATDHISETFKKQGLYLQNFLEIILVKYCNKFVLEKKFLKSLFPYN